MSHGAAEAYCATNKMMPAGFTVISELEAIFDMFSSLGISSNESKKKKAHVFTQNVLKKARAPAPGAR